MNRRHLHGIGLLLAVVALALPGAPALAGAGAARTPQASVRWSFGPSSPFGGTRFDGEYVADLGRVYFLGFRTFGDLTDGSVWYLDVATGAYVDTGVDMPLPISNYGIAALNDPNGLGLYIFGGRTGQNQIVPAVQVYYPATNTAMAVPSDPYPGMTSVGCVSLPAMGVAATSNRAVVMGGLSFASSGCLDGQSAETWVFNPMAPAGSRWTQGPDLNVPRGYITPAVLGGRIYAIGGDVNVAGTLFAQPTVEAWQPPAGGWNDAAVADLPVGCDESQAFPFASGPLPGIILAGCGQWPDAQPYTVHWDSATNMWSLVGMLNDNRRNHAGAVVPVGGRPRMFVLGGYGEVSAFIDPIQTSEVGRPVPSGAPGGDISTTPDPSYRNQPTS